jgi:phospholipid transport system substrate-binding protein
VKGTINDLIQVLDDEPLQHRESPKNGACNRRHHQTSCGLRGNGETCTGASWFTLSHRDQHEFVDLFVQLLQDTFVGRITELSDEQVVFLGEFREDVFAVVKAQMNGRKIDKPVDFRLIHRAHK